MVVILNGYSSVNSLSQFLTVLLLFVFVLAITYFVTKYIANYQKLQGQNRNFEIIETFRVTNNKYLQLVRAADKYIVIAVGKDEITKIAELDEENIIKPLGSTPLQNEAFASLISKAKDKIKKGGNDE